MHCPLSSYAFAVSPSRTPLSVLPILLRYPPTPLLRPVRYPPTPRLPAILLRPTLLRLCYALSGTGAACMALHCKRKHKKPHFWCE
eukprot:868429-Rhodomonas_salina.1